MNKTVNINLGGLFFHIDEDAYIKLTRYFEAIKKQLTDTQGMNEIISDIEIRISELFSEQINPEKQVITMSDLDQVISIMGEPKDYRIDDEEANHKASTNYNYKSRQLYRDIDKNALGGVCRGLSYYWNMDVILVRILMVLLFIISQGIGILVYLILWIVVPAARTTSEKLEMKGEPVNISNIEKKVREEFGNISEKMNSIDYEKYKNQAQNGAKNFGNSVGNFFSGVFNIIGKLIGTFIILTSISALALLIITIFTFGSTDFFNTPWSTIADGLNYINVPYWVLGILVFLAVGIPFIMFLVLGIRILIPNSNSLGKVFKFSMLGIWIISLISIFVISIKQKSEVAFQEKSVERLEILATNDTLNFATAINDIEESKKQTKPNLFLNENNEEMFINGKVKFTFKSTSNANGYIEIQKTANGNSLIDAKERANNIKYNLNITDNKIEFNDYLLVNKFDKYRDQFIKINVYIPNNVPFKIDSNFKSNWRSITAEYSNEYDELSTNKIYKFNNNELICLNCYDNQSESLNQNKILEENLNTNISTDSIKIRAKNELIISSEGTVTKNSN